ncbi:MAG: hypothetical protein WAW88_08800 [Nocardioides sp.]
MIIDEDGPWTAAAYLATDPEFAGTQHGMGETGTLCGLAEDEVAVVRNPFYGTQPMDCDECAGELRRLAATCPVCGSPELTQPPYRKWPPPPGVLLKPPYEDQLGLPSYEVCPNCGFEFGNDDNPGTAVPVSFAHCRAEWEADGSARFDQSTVPPVASGRTPRGSVVPVLDLSDLPGEWWTVRGSVDAAELERELARELAVGHVLRGVRVEAVAVKRHLKDVVFWLPESGQWAWVHLTHAVETDPRWPIPIITSNWADLVGEMTGE